MIALCADRLIDGNGTNSYGPATILVQDGLIANVGPTALVDVPDGTEVIHLDNLTMLPGIIDAHTHFGLSFPHGISKGNNYDVLLRAVEFAKQCLHSGVTTARTLSERDYLDVAYRNAIEQGWIEGPRTLIATRGLQPHHSHVGVTDVQVTGTDDVRRVVRQNLAAQADVIKLYLTPPSGAANPTQAYFSLPEIQTAVEEAHCAGKRVAVHAHGGKAIDDAITANVDTIEHGIYITPEQHQRMAERGTWLVGTQTIRLWNQDGPGMTTALSRAREGTEETMRLAREHGVKVAVGTDGAHGLMYFELECLVRAGFSPMDAIQAGTRRGAEALGIDANTGTLERGKWADVIGVVGDPLSDIREMQNVAFVMKAGRIVKRPDANIG